MGFSITAWVDARVQKALQTAIPEISSALIADSGPLVAAVSSAIGNEITSQINNLPQVLTQAVTTAMVNLPQEVASAVTQLITHPFGDTKPKK